jgi:hypothetical protein
LAAFDPVKLIHPRGSLVMSRILTPLLVLVGLLAGLATHGSITAMTIDGAVGISSADVDAANCDMTKAGKMEPADCASICAVASADVARVTPLRHPSMQQLWRLADLSAEGLKPSPTPTPPRV